jgi:hypothetical protein
MKTLKTLALTGLFAAFTMPAIAHIDLLSPKPLLDGKAQKFRALKQQPFGAPGIDVAAAEATTFHSGQAIDVKVDSYVYHPGEIVFLWTRDFAGRDQEPAWEIANMETPIPHTNFLGSIESPCVEGEDGKCLRGRKGQSILDTTVTLPDVEGEIILIVRQVMTDKLDIQNDGSVSLKRIYYHQAAKINLVKS